MDLASREMVRQRAAGRCEYCRIHEDDEPYAFHLEHIIAKKHGGRDDLSNLAWSCHSCNLAKGANLSGRVHSEVVTLFHPRRQQWNRHFRWMGPILAGKTNAIFPPPFSHRVNRAPQHLAQSRPGKQRHKVVLLFRQ